MAGIGELEVEAQPGDAVGLRLRCARNDVHVVLGEHIGHIAQQAGPVERLDLDRHDVVAGRVVVPLDVDDPVALACGGSTRSRSRSGAPRHRGRG